MYPGDLTDVEGIKIGHQQSEEGMTGVSVIIYEEGATGGVDVRGSAPGTRETDLFEPEKMVDKVHAVVLSGGSAFGLDASSGVMNYLEDQGIGFDVGVTNVPIVSSAVIFDLDIGDYRIRPDAEMGYAAAKKATTAQSAQGNVGAGKGATVGKILGPGQAMKGGLGSASVRVGDLVVSAMVVVNSFGDIYDPRNNQQIAGVFDYEQDQLLHTVELMKKPNLAIGFDVKNTTIGVIATNATLTKAEANKTSQMAQNGLARTIHPVHTMIDGDTVFTMATNKVEADINLVGTLATEVMSKAIINGILSAEGVNGIKSHSDIKK